jgi:hypothetical protein
MSSDNFASGGLIVPTSGGATPKALQMPMIVSAG